MDAPYMFDFPWLCSMHVLQCMLLRCLIQKILVQFMGDNQQMGILKKSQK